MKTAVIQFNPVVGDIEGNLARHISLYREAAEGNADLVVFPEMSLSGYPIEDLAFRTSFIETVRQAANTFLDIVNATRYGPAVIFGLPVAADEGGTANEAWFFDPAPLEDSDAMAVVRKVELPNYGVFDEKRNFTGGAVADCLPINIRGLRVGVMICEDAWWPSVTNALVGRGAHMLLSINGSPFEAGKNVTRRKVVAERIKDSEVGFLYVNMVGGQDELVFDGGSFLYDGLTVQEAPAFEEGLFWFDIDPDAVSDVSLDNYPQIEPTGIPDIYRAIVLGTRDYMGKQRFASATLGMSGGVDSGIVAAIACDAVGPENVHLVSLPSKFSSEGSKSDAIDAADRLDAPLRTIAIEPVADALRAAYTSAHQHIPAGMMVDQQYRPIPPLAGTADENIQARARGDILMAISNQEGHILLTTGNKSEVSVGYSTLYGDMAGGFNPIKDCYKIMVWALCRYRNTLLDDDLAALGYFGRGGVDVVPEAIITKPPSAELAPDQKDENTLGSYENLDRILHMHIEENLSVDEIIASTGLAADYVERISRLIYLAEYKRRQAAPGVKITGKLHNRDRRYPIVSAWRR